MLGRSLGNYQVVSKIGEGGMGVVYLARHVTLGRPAAVKVLHPELTSNQDIVTRFFNEARAATAVRNPGIVEVFDFGFLEDRSAYIVMEYLEGESLGARMRRGRSTIAVTLTIVRAIARALHAAHEQGIVHRDLKPDNVFLVPDSELPSGERVKLLDFGIAKLASVGGEASHTRTGTVMGTPTYMAPEQCRGAGSVDHRADLYALGCVAYEMLCGQPPFVAEGAGDVIARHLYFQPSPLRSHRPDLPAEIDDLVLWLLQKDPGARPATAMDLVRTVERLLGAAPPAVTRPENFAAEVSTARPMVMETTLSGAASANAVPRTGPGTLRVRLIAGAATTAIAMLVIVLWARGGHESGEVGSSTSTVVAAGDPNGSNSPAPLPTPAAPAHPVGAPTTAAAAPAPSRGAEGDATPPVPQATAPDSSVPDATRPVDTVKPATPPTSPEPAPRPAKPTATPRQNETARPSAPAKSDDTDKSGHAAKPPDAACTRAAFAAVLDVDAPGESAVQAALGRLRRCKATMNADLFSDIQHQLIGKL
jgi:serine/threonine protein kinase